ncbi:MAG: SDR family NAD(P)-dependent oxidoreductase [Nevskiaceae bacterium]|nr:MAG: SDR family NAD(P)-dependent oxidoreductase [Nevskiaceae bacterium]
MTRKWTQADMPSLRGQRAIVTGANRGLGFEITAGLAAAGADVILACRDERKAETAIDALRRRVPNAALAAMSLDLADLASVRRFAQAFAGRHDRLDLLVNNASAIMVPLQQTRDGFEMHLGSNHLGPYALTGLLMPQLLAAPSARIVNTSSMAHRLTPGIDFDDLHFERTAYKEMDAYGRSKLATLLFTFELDRRLRKAALPARAVAAHPGYTATNTDLGNWFMRLMTRLIAQPPAMGALPALYAATAPAVQGGDYYGPGGFKELGGYPAKVDCRPEARDPQLAARLWAVSEALSGVTYAAL